jgi:hypothetical protein
MKAKHCITAIVAFGLTVAPTLTAATVGPATKNGAVTKPATGGA